MIYTSCLRCGATETTNRLFFHCDFAKQVWNITPWSSRLDPDGVISFGSKLQSSRQRINLTINLFPWIAWVIWTSRNLLIFKNRALTPSSRNLLIFENRALTPTSGYTQILKSSSEQSTGNDGRQSSSEFYRILLPCLFLSHFVALVSFPEQTMGRPTGLSNLLFRMVLVGS